MFLLPHVSSLKEPGSEFPKAMFLAIGLVLVIFILPTLAISWVIPAQQLSLTAGVMQAFSGFFGHFGVSFLVPIVAIMLVIASTSGMLAWLAGPSKGLLMIGRQEDQITAALGNDGGAASARTPTAALRKATQNALLYNGASLVGMRPVLVDRAIVEGEALILKVYCPDTLQDYQDRIDDLKFDDTVKD